MKKSLIATLQISTSNRQGRPQIGSFTFSGSVSKYIENRAASWHVASQPAPGPVALLQRPDGQR